MIGRGTRIILRSVEMGILVGIGFSASMVAHWSYHWVWVAILAWLSFVLGAFSISLAAMVRDPEMPELEEADVPYRPSKNVARFRARGRE